MIDSAEYDEQPRQLISCRNCGRTFNPEALIKHEKICRQTTSNHRKVFDSSKQRSVGGTSSTNVGNVKNRQRQQLEPRKSSNWRQKHQDFIRTVRAARGVTIALKSGKELPPPPPPTINPDYVQCPHCSRRFNEGAAERHIKFCADQHKRLETRSKGKTALTLKAAAKQDRRTSYRPPLPSSGIRRTSNSHSSSRTTLGQNTPPTQKTVKNTMGPSKTGTQRTRDRSNEERPFDTRMPSNSVATTKTGLKARVSSNGFYRNGFEDKASVSKHKAEEMYRFPNHREPRFHENDKQSTSRKVSNLQERKRHDYNLSSSAGVLNSLSNKHFPDLTTEKGSRNDQRGRRTYEQEHSTSHQYDFLHEPDELSHIGGVPMVGSKKPSRSKFCHECGTPYPVSVAKFCCECGMRRINI